MRGILQAAVGGLAVVLMTGGLVSAQVKTTGGMVQGTAIADGAIRVFKGIPFAAPPTGAQRWRAPQPVAPWTGVRDASAYGSRCTQGQLFSDIVFTDLSEDCLTVNLWTPAKAAGDRLPVMVWIHGGGFQAGAGAEPRHDGEVFARKGVVLVTFNYRLGVFGFLAHPELTRESGRNASGNYGLLDQVAALQWVRDNIAAFGGDPGNVTIFGESAGSFSVSALMATPLARGLFHKAIGQSGAFFTGGAGTLALAPLATTEERGARFAAAVGAESLAALREKPAADLLAAALKTQPGFAPNLDGHVFVEDVWTTFEAGRQSHVPLLAGWNKDEMRQAVTMRPQKPTAASFAEETRKRFGADADAILLAYPASTDAEALEAAAALASDLFIGQNTWTWIETHLKTGQSPVYRYRFDRQIPIGPGRMVMGVAVTAKDVGARHAGEIEYVFGTLDASLPKVPWEAADRALSDTMTTYWANFARTGDPNGAGLEAWPRYEGTEHRLLHLDVAITSAPDTLRSRYLSLDAYVRKQRARVPPPAVRGPDGLRVSRPANDRMARSRE